MYSMIGTIGRRRVLTTRGKDAYFVQASRFLGQTPAQRTDIENLNDNLPEPIELDLDLGNRMLYWTDRGDPPRGNTVNRAPMDPSPRPLATPEILITHLMEGIGLALDLKGNRMFVTDLAGSVNGAGLDGLNLRILFVAMGNLAGIAYMEPTRAAQ